LFKFKISISFKRITYVNLYDTSGHIEVGEIIR